MFSLYQISNKSWYQKYFYHQDQEIILAYLIQQERTFIFTHPEFKFSLTILLRFLYYLSRRRQDYPLAYLVQKKEFYNLTFTVNKHTLIPRPESELFIDQINIIQPAQEKISDLGTSSGCLVITAAKLWPNNQFFGSDISKKALQIARCNGHAHATNITLLTGDLLTPYYQNNIKPTIILANLPYLKPEELKEKTILHEPRGALLGGNNGLRVYKRLLEQINQYHYQPKFLFLEINPEQVTQMTYLLQQKMPAYQYDLITDTQGLNRLVKIYLSSTKQELALNKFINR
ncbi:MAG: hypothetical protein COX77_00155 [Candidatus Komeilibacteria bacterium CG_4_10_14_0_2_um_filter_37_10]|uniref:peptide chain release factor N(5)-glutamine methyltransferase n=1 Tax=Candidatus Komeilibacteria bacterium CG_4_10_14_0_2_um_filter_37_10 TaxID=1974470 RepID=A0A2M7VGN7_9BACT|nr:MAG: hypothetical protein COX77_00155 [Candidatus Komeilibacteria bacterium CG_4_10_14_0_2_um_filter_37_10]